MRRLWWLIVGGLLIAALAWAAYVAGGWLVLDRPFPRGAVETAGWSAVWTSLQAYLVAFGPLRLVLAAIAFLLLRGPRVGQPSERGAA